MMTNATTENFWQAWNNMVWPDAQPISLRLYYNADGTPELYTMENLPGDYIEVDAETYALRSFGVRVIDQQLVHVQPKRQINKLQPNPDNGISCDPSDVCVVVDKTQPHIKWSIQTNETD
jgi:hypothetical protein